MCGNVLCGRTDPGQPFFSPQGSFWTNSTTQLLATTTERDRQARTRNRCNGEGYESVALIPLRAGGVTYGLLQFNDRRRGRFTPERIALFEQLGQSLALALAEHQAREELRASEARLRLALDASNQGIFELDLVTRRATANAELAHMLGYPLEHFPDNVWREHIHPDDRALILRVYEMAAGESGILTAEFRTQARDGAWRWLLARGKVVARDPAGRPLRVLGTIMDITERKRTEQALRQSEEQYRGLMESLDSMVATVDYDGKYLYMNDVAAAQLGGAAQNLIGKTIAELFPEPTAAQQLAYVRQVIDDDHGTVAEFPSLLMADSCRAARLCLTPPHTNKPRVRCARVKNRVACSLKPRRMP
jgi:PAS domain S-box-containing protein